MGDAHVVGSGSLTYSLAPLCAPFHFMYVPNNVGTQCEKMSVLDGHSTILPILNLMTSSAGNDGKQS